MMMSCWGHFSGCNYKVVQRCSYTPTMKTGTSENTYFSKVIVLFVALLCWYVGNFPILCLSVRYKVYYTLTLEQQHLLFLFKHFCSANKTSIPPLSQQSLGVSITATFCPSLTESVSHRTAVFVLLVIHIQMKLKHF